jgi:WD40 repeat protein
MWFWDLAANTRSSYVLPKPPLFSAFAVAREGSLAAGGYADGNVELWRFPGGNQVASWRAHDDRVTAMAHSPRANLLATASGGEVKLWDIGTKRLLKQFRVTRPILNRLAFSLTQGSSEAAAKQ